MQQEITLWPPVQHLTVTDPSSCFNTSVEINILWLAPCPPQAALTELAKQYGVKIRFEKKEDCFMINTSNCSLETIEIPHELGEQGYRIQVNTKGINAAATSLDGLNYALLRIFELLKLSVLPELTINDWPNCNHRGIMIDLARVVESPEFITSLLPFLAGCRLNQVYLYLENKLIFDSHPKLAHPMAWTKDEIRNLIGVAKDYNIEIIPMIATIGHMESILSVPEYRHLQAANTNDHLDTALPEARKFIRDIIEEVCQLFESKYVHLAGDECPYLGIDIQESVSKYAGFMNFMSDILNEYNRKGIIWADMIEKYPGLLKSISKDLILTVWKYYPVDSRPITQPDEYTRAGFDTAVAPGILADEPFLPTIERLTRNLPFLPRKTGLWGVINCMWEPRTQTLPVARLGIAAAGACSWNPFMINSSNLISKASEYTYGEDISKLYSLLEGGKFFDMMIQSKFAFYHSFELSCNNPLLHLCEPESSEWQQLSSMITDGLNHLKVSKHLFKKYQDDFKAFEACATLAKTLSDCIVLMHRTGKAINAGIKSSQLIDIIAQLHSLIDYMQKTLIAQRIAWNICRKEYDPNYNWWFEDPLMYKIKCLSKFVDSLAASQKASSSNITLAELDYFLFKFNKSDAKSWNLLRIKIFYSDCGYKWEQVFFKTIPLWMDDCLNFKLMPCNGELPNYVKIVPIYATWHRASNNWNDMIEISCGKINMTPNKIYNENIFPATDIYDVNSTAVDIILKKRNQCATLNYNFD